MSLPKMLAILAFILFSTIGVAAFFKGGPKESSAVTMTKNASAGTPLEVELENEISVVAPITKTNEPIVTAPVSVAQPEPTSAAAAQVKSTPAPIKVVENVAPPEVKTGNVPEANRINEFFNKVDPKFPFVETIVYKSRVPWQKGRPAWLSDYATYYSTSRHFIARSLNGKADYFKQDVAEGDKFNVLKKDKNIEFYLVIDASRCKLWFYVYDADTKERTLVKTYQVGLGRVDASKPSGLLTPLGKYSLGSKIAIYKPKMMGTYNNQKVEMIRIFGSRWIPFEKEYPGATAPAKGFGIHGVPWVANEKGELIQDKASLGKYESDGCVRLATEDVEELFAIIITKPAYVELVKDFFDAKLPGTEVANR